MKGIVSDNQLIAPVNRAIEPAWIEAEMPVYDPEVFSVETKKWKKLDADNQIYSCIATLTGSYYTAPKSRLRAYSKDFTITRKLEVTKSDPPTFRLLTE